MKKILKNSRYTLFVIFFVVSFIFSTTQLVSADWVTGSGSDTYSVGCPGNTHWNGSSCVPDQYTLSTTTAGNGSGSASGGVFNYNTTGTASQSPGTGSYFSGWTGACNSSGQVTMDADKSCTANFTLYTYTLSTGTAGNGSGSASGGTYTYGSTGTASQSASIGSYFSGWTGACNSSGQVYMDADKSCTANFTLYTYTLSTGTAGNGSGSASGGVYNYGATGTASQSPSTGSHFSGWSGACNSSGQVYMDANKSCTANFTLNTYQLTLSTAGTGSGSTSPSYFYNYGSTANPTATPSTGSYFSGWSGACAGSGTTSPASVYMDGPKSCTANFTLNTYTLSVGTNGTGSGSVTGAGTYNYATTATATATPASNSTFSGWSGSCNSAGQVYMDANKSCTATFTVIPPPAPSLYITGSTWGIANGSTSGTTYTGSGYTLGWGAVANASSCSLGYYGGGATGGGSVTGSASGWAGNSRTFTLNCSGPGGSGASSVTINYPPDPTGVTLSCSANGQTATAGWVAPSGWNTFYTRATPPNYALYNDAATGTSASFGTTPGTSYSFWVHTRASNGAWSNAVYGYTTCPNPAPTATLNITDNWAYSSYVHYNISTYAWNDSGVALTWSSANATACTVYDNGSPRWSGTSNGGLAVGAISASSHTYMINCTNPYSGTTGTDTRVLTIPSSPTSVAFSPTSCVGNVLNLTWNQNPSYGKGAPYIYDNGSLIYNGDASNVGGSGSVPINTTPGHNYTAIVYARDGTQPSWPYSSGVNPTAVSCPPTTGTISASPASCTVAAGASTCNTTLTWNTNNPVSNTSSAITRPTSIMVVTGNSGSGSYAVPYGGSIYYLYHAGGLLAQTPNVAASCVAGTTWTGSLCALPSGTLTSSANSCAIAVRGNSCTIPFSWSTSYPITTSAVTRDGAGTVATANSGSNVAFTVPYSSATFRLYNNGNELANKSVTSGCTAGTVWNSTSGTCVPLSTVTITANPNPVTYNTTSTVSWTSTDAISCSVSNGSTGTSGSFTTPTLRSPVTYTISCTGWAGGSNGSVTINVIPTATFTVTPKLLISRKPAKLSWTSTNATSCTGTNFSTTGLTQSDATHTNVTPISTTTYTLTCTGPGGSVVKTLKAAITKVIYKER